LDKEKTMYTRILIPLDGSKTAEKVLPYARFLASKLKLPVELLAIVDIVELGLNLSPENAHLLETAIENAVHRRGQYLRGVADTFPGVEVKCAVDKGVAAEVIIEKAAEDNRTLISMSAQGRSGDKPLAVGKCRGKGPARCRQSAVIDSSGGGSEVRGRGNPQVGCGDAGRIRVG
jgi:nucleotide-binding universal stress UspA family protein